VQSPEYRLHELAGSLTKLREIRAERCDNQTFEDFSESLTRFLRRLPVEIDHAHAVVFINPNATG
jgi:hypothetical protein